MKTRSTPTRVAEDVARTASDVAAAENRSASEQISYWARIGMNVDRAGSVATRRVLDAAAGRIQFASLDDEERAAAHALIDARVSELAARERFGPASRGSGHATVSLDDDGRLVEIAADGTRRPL